MRMAFKAQQALCSDQLQQETIASWQRLQRSITHVYNTSSLQWAKAAAASRHGATAAHHQVFEASRHAAEWFGRMQAGAATKAGAAFQLLADHPMALSLSLYVVAAVAAIVVGVQLLRGLVQAAGNAMLQCVCGYVRKRYYSLYFLPCLKYQMCCYFCGMVAVCRLARAAGWWGLCQLDGIKCDIYWGQVAWFLAPVVTLVVLTVVMWRAYQEEYERCASQRIWPAEVKWQRDNALAKLEARGAGYVALWVCLACMAAVCGVCLWYICVSTNSGWLLLVTCACLVLWAALSLLPPAAVPVIPSSLLQLWWAVWCAMYTWAPAAPRRVLCSALGLNDVGMAELRAFILRDRFACLCRPVLWRAAVHMASCILAAGALVTGCSLAYCLYLPGTAMGFSRWAAIALCIVAPVPVPLMLVYASWQKYVRRYDALINYVLRSRTLWDEEVEYLAFVWSCGPAYWLVLQGPAWLSAALSPACMVACVLQLVQAIRQRVYAWAAAAAQRVLYAALGITEAGMAEMRVYVSKPAVSRVCRSVLCWEWLQWVSLPWCLCALVVGVVSAMTVYPPGSLRGGQDVAAWVLLAATPFLMALIFMDIADRRYEHHASALAVMVGSSPPRWARTTADRHRVLATAPTYWWALQVEQAGAWLAAALSPVHLVTRTFQLWMATVGCMYAWPAAAASNVTRAVLCRDEPPIRDMFGLVGQPAFASAWLPVLRWWLLRVVAGVLFASGTVASMLLVTIAASVCMKVPVVTTLVAVVVGLLPVLVGALLFWAANTRVTQMEKALSSCLHGCPHMELHVDRLGSAVWYLVDCVQRDAPWYWLALQVESCGGWVLQVVLAAVVGVHSGLVVLITYGSSGSAMVVLVLAASLAAACLWVLITSVWTVACWWCVPAAAVVCQVLGAALSLMSATARLLVYLLQLGAAAGRYLWVKAAAAARRKQPQQLSSSAARVTARCLFGADAAAGACVVAEVRLRPSAPVHKDASRCTAAADQAPATVQRKAQSVTGSPAKDSSQRSPQHPSPLKQA
jgi:hypothetical protein